ncbi:MAG: hypothetical protein ACI90G_001093 [Urechidicola sp.]|jgi:hypothetical protein
MRVQGIVASLLALASMCLFATEPVVTVSTVIVGNQEQPKVLYLLPWQGVSLQENTMEVLQRRSYGVFDHESPGIWQPSWRAQQPPASEATWILKPD